MKGIFIFLLQLIVSQKVIIFDAGSSGTRIHLYEYTNSSDPANFSACIDKNQKPVTSSIKIPLANALNNNTIMKSIIDPLLNYIGNYSTLEEKKSISIILYATAGMRKLNKSDQEIILNDCYDYITKNYEYKASRNEFRVIEGYEEAMFAWISVNRLVSHFDDRNLTIPIFEIGGASAQIATEQSDLDQDVSPYTHNVSIGNKNFKVFCHSWLGFGYDDAMGILHKNILDTGSYETPCALTGSTLTLKLPDRKSVSFYGKVNFSKCYSMFSDIVYKQDQNCGKYKCTFTNVPLSNDFIHRKEMYGMGVVTYSADFLQLPPSMNVSVFRKKAEEFSALTYQEALDKYYNYAYLNDTLPQQIVSLNFMERGLFSVSNLILKAPKKINGVEPQWTLGAILAARSPGVIVHPKDHSIKPWIYVAAVSVVMIGGLLVFLLIRRSRNSIGVITKPLII